MKFDVPYDYRMVGCETVDASSPEEAKELVEEMFLSGVIGTGAGEDCAEYEIYEPEVSDEEDEDEDEEEDI